MMPSQYRGARPLFKFKFIREMDNNDLGHSLIGPKVMNRGSSAVAQNRHDIRAR
jgi:hypothetical protein